jgi:hypothetical protein
VEIRIPRVDRFKIETAIIEEMGLLVDIPSHSNVLPSKLPFASAQ